MSTRGLAEIVLLDRGGWVPLPLAQNIFVPLPSLLLSVHRDLLGRAFCFDWLIRSWQRRAILVHLRIDRWRLREALSGHPPLHFWEISAEWLTPASHGRLSEHPTVRARIQEEFGELSTVEDRFDQGLPHESILRPKLVSRIGWLRSSEEWLKLTDQLSTVGQEERQTVGAPSYC